MYHSSHSSEYPQKSESRQVVSDERRQSSGSADEDDGNAERVSPSEVIGDQSDEERTDQHAAHVERVVERTPEVTVAGKSEVGDQGRSDDAGNEIRGLGVK